MYRFIDALSEESKDMINGNPGLKEKIKEFRQHLKILDAQTFLYSECDLMVLKIKDEKTEIQLKNKGISIFRLSRENPFIKEKAETEEIEIIQEISSRILLERS